MISAKERAKENRKRAKLNPPGPNIIKMLKPKPATAMLALMEEEQDKVMVHKANQIQADMINTAYHEWSNNYEVTYQASVPTLPALPSIPYVKYTPIIPGYTPSGAGGGASFMPGYISPMPENRRMVLTKQKTEEEQNDDLYDCPRGCSKRMDFKDLQAHIQVGCENTRAAAGAAGYNTIFHARVDPGDSLATPYGVVVNNDSNPIEVIINRI